MTGFDSTISRLAAALLRPDSQEVNTLLAGLPSREALVVTTLEKIGQAWEEGRISLSQVYMAGKICERSLEQLRPAEATRPERGPRLAIAVLEDHHSLGKRMVKSALHAAGYHPLDYGHGCKADELVAKAEEDQLDLLLISCLMLASAVRVQEVVAGLARTGIPTLVAVGGAPFRLDPRLGQAMGAWAVGGNSAEAVGIVQQNG
ncbi:MAG: cobalamin-dependent protein [Deltaproteobacteria bacterium]|nr:cobalamin-dependent protein [Deltaproteobacteria bacterium]